MNKLALTLACGLGWIAASAWAKPVSTARDAQVTVELVPEFAQAVAGRPNWLALRVVPEPGWHTYWVNPGDAGLATRQKWILPERVTTQPSLWPYPTAYREGPLVTYGFGEEHVLLTAVEVPGDYPAASLPLALEVRWLACKDICIPGRASLSLDWPVAMAPGAARRPPLFAKARLRIPADARDWSGQFAGDDAGLDVFLPVPGEFLAAAQSAEFFPAAKALVDHAAAAVWESNGQGLIWRMPISPEFIDWPGQLDGVLVLQGQGAPRAFDVRLTAGAVPDDGQAWGQKAQAAPARTEIGLLLAAAFAFLGGLILNLMPCVFPVLALKALSLAGAEHAHERRSESLYYAAGVVLSFLCVAALLLGLRAAGAALGWGFQLQNPVVVGVLAYLMLVVGLGLANWTQIGMSWMGLGQQLVQQSGHKGAFLTGVLAVVVASPCTAPFMGAALGYAVTQNPPTALAVFAALGVGMAFPFLLVSWVPALANRLPRPGPWMETFKKVLAWPMFATAGWLMWVLYRQTSGLGLMLALLGALLIAVAVRQSPGGRWVSERWAAGLLVLALAGFLLPPFHGASPQAPISENWMTYSDQVVADLRASGRPVFVNFTASWCISCLVNEQAALSNGAVRELIDAERVAMVKADWTNYDPQITQALARFGRNGVPLYLLYPRGGGEPVVLPQLLTPGIVRQALEAAVAGGP